MTNILLAGTGSVAAIKFLRLYDALEELGEVKSVVTNSAMHFLSCSTKSNDFNTSGSIVLADRIIAPSNKEYLVYQDHFEWKWDKLGDPIQHIELKDWANVLVIAPLSANTLGKMANGICDNMLTSIYRAWPLLEKPIVVAPAMNTNMWNHPVTKEHLNKLRMWQFQHRFSPNNSSCNSSCIDLFKVVPPVESNLACGVYGMGAMANIFDIVQNVKKAINE